MILYYLKKITILFVLFCTTLLSASSIDISKNNFSLLEQSEIYLDEENKSYDAIVNGDYFKPYHETYLNISNAKKQIWIKITLENPTHEKQEKILLFSSSFLEHIYLFDAKGSASTRGQAHFEQTPNTLLPYFNISLAPNSEKTFYLKVYSDYTPVLFKLLLIDEDTYVKDDKKEQALDILLIGVIFALMLYSLFISVYLKDKSYFFYSIYLFVLLYDQMRYLGLTQIYFPTSFMQFDLDFTIVRIYLLSLTSSLFVIYFFKLKSFPKLYKLYWSVIIFCIICIVFLYDSIEYGITIVMPLSFVVIVMHFFVGVYVYSKGQKQARFYLVGFGTVFFFYLLIISDSLGFSNFLQEHHNALLMATTFEAFVLSLAFSDRYIILQKEKETISTRYLKESKSRESIIEEEVTRKTAQLHTALESKKLLLKEVHHRVKNNLHIILSMIQLQHNSPKVDIDTLLQDLENRINAIAKTYDMLIMNENLQEIDMKPYIEELLHDIQESFYCEGCEVSVTSKIEAVLPLQKAVYIGLIINEAVTNSYKYAFKANQGHIHVVLTKKEGQYRLHIADDGTGFSTSKKVTSMGVSLIKTLAEEQLHGTCALESKGKTTYTIYF